MKSKSEDTAKAKSISCCVVNTALLCCIQKAEWKGHRLRKLWWAHKHWHTLGDVLLMAPCWWRGIKSLVCMSACSLMCTRICVRLFLCTSWMRVCVCVLVQLRWHCLGIEPGHRPLQDVARKINATDSSAHRFSPQAQVSLLSNDFCSITHLIPLLAFVSLSSQLYLCSPGQSFIALGFFLLHLFLLLLHCFPFPAFTHRHRECVKKVDGYKCDFCQQEEKRYRDFFLKTYPKSRPVRRTFTQRHTVTGRESHICVSFIGDDTLLCSNKWVLMSDGPAYESPTGQPLVIWKWRKKIMSKGGRDRGSREPENMREGEAKEGKKMQSWFTSF